MPRNTAAATNAAEYRGGEERPLLRALPGVLDESFHGKLGEGLLEMQEREPDNAEDANHFRAAQGEKLRRGVQSPTGGNQVVHKEKLLPRMDVASMHLENVFPVFERESDAVGLPGKLSLLPEEDQGQAAAEGKRGGKDEPAGFNGGNGIHLRP